MLLRVVMACACLLAFAPVTAQAGPSAGGLGSDNVEWLRNIVTHWDTSGAKLHEGYFYVTTERDLSIYDVKVPENPTLVGSMLLPEFGDPTYTEEDPDTNGKVLPVSNGGVFSVIDVSDKTAPRVLSRIEGLDPHTLTCVLDCTWVYGSGGAIIDLRDPANPKLMDNQWDGANPVQSSHDVTEVSPGLVLTATYPMRLLDARTDPSQPTTLAQGSLDEEQFIHAVLWPQKGTDQLILSGGEGFGPACSSQKDSSFNTWHTAGWQQSGRFRPGGAYHLEPGAYVDGRNVAQTWCTHWFREHPSFRNGGMVALAWYEQGTRFLHVRPDGSIEEIGWFLPHAGQTSAVYWITDRILYTADYYRGVDVLRWTGDIPPTGPSNSVPPPSRPATPPSQKAKTFSQVVRIPRCARKQRLRVRFRGATVKRATAWVNGKRVVRGKGAKLAGLQLRGLPRKRFKLTVSITTADRRTLTGHRTVKTCK